MIGLRNSPGTPEGLRHRRRRSPSPPASAPASASDSRTTDSGTINSGTGPKPLRGRASLLPLLCLLGLASLLGLSLVAGWGLLAVGCGDLLGTDGEAGGRGGEGGRPAAASLVPALSHSMSANNGGTHLHECEV